MQVSKELDGQTVSDGKTNAEKGSRCSMWLLHEFVMCIQSLLNRLGMACPSGH